jgi:hypothetical protein
VSVGWADVNGRAPSAVAEARTPSLCRPVVAVETPSSCTPVVAGGPVSSACVSVGVVGIACKSDVEAGGCVIVEPGQSVGKRGWSSRPSSTLSSL